MDKAKSKQDMPQNVETMKVLGSSPKLPRRIRSAVQDLVNLRANNWEARKKKEGQKEIEEGHRDSAGGPPAIREASRNPEKPTREGFSGGGGRSGGRDVDAEGFRTVGPRRVKRGSRGKKESAIPVSVQAKDSSIGLTPCSSGWDVFSPPERGQNQGSGPCLAEDPPTILETSVNPQKPISFWRFDEPIQRGWGELVEEPQTEDQMAWTTKEILEEYILYAF